MRRKYAHLKREETARAAKLTRIATKQAQHTLKREQLKHSGVEVPKGKGCRLVDGVSKQARRNRAGAALISINRMGRRLNLDSKSDADPADRIDWKSTRQNEDELTRRRKNGDIVTTVNGDIWVVGIVEGRMDLQMRKPDDDDDDFVDL